MSILDLLWFVFRTQWTMWLNPCIDAPVSNCLSLGKTRTRNPIINTDDSFEVETEFLLGKINFVLLYFI